MGGERGNGKWSLAEMTKIKFDGAGVQDKDTSMQIKYTTMNMNI